MGRKKLNWGTIALGGMEDTVGSISLDLARLAKSIGGAEANIPNDHPAIIVMVGRLIKLCGFDTAVEAQAIQACEEENRKD